MVEWGVATAAKLFVVELRQFTLCGIDAEETVLAVSLAMLCLYSGPVEEDMGPGGVEI